MMHDFKDKWITVPILNQGFDIIIGKLNAKNEKDQPYRFRPAHTVTHTDTHKEHLITTQNVLSWGKNK